MTSSRTSKLLSLVLRHDPARVGIVLDAAGWTEVAPLLEALAAHGVALTRAELTELVTSSDKQRFALSPDGTRIRANQGHSVDVELDLPRATPPPCLYHGTVERFVASIRERGLVKGARHHVHLSADVETARRVGGRRGAPVILTVRAAAMAAAGYAFFRSANGVWLTAHVPAAFLELPAPPPRRGAGSGSRAAKVAIARATLAACDAGRYVNAGDEVIELGPAIAAARRGTRSYDLATYPARGASPAGVATRIEVTGESTIEAIRRLGAGGGHVACLNFASARRAGGGFLGGAQAQEEALARSSALYPCLLEAPDHYARHAAHASALYLDLAIWSPGVPFFRDDDGGWFDAPVACSVITCAAPNAGALRQHGRFDAAEVEATLRRRAQLVLAIARDHAVETLVLGAWGAGVFGNDPAVVARVFQGHLAGAFAGAFARVAFAVLGGPGQVNHDAFAAVFASERSRRG